MINLFDEKCNLANSIDQDELATANIAAAIIIAVVIIIAYPTPAN